MHIDIKILKEYGEVGQVIDIVTKINKLMENFTEKMNQIKGFLVWKMFMGTIHMLEHSL